MKKFIAVVSLLFATGIVYALFSDSLSVTGYASLNGNVDLNIINISVADARVGEAVTYPTGDNSRHTINFNVFLSFPGDIRLINFQLRNIGNAAAIVQNWTLTGQTREGIYIEWPPTEGLIILPGQTSEMYAIEAGWNPTAFNVPHGSLAFTVTVNYRL